MSFRNFPAGVFVAGGGAAVPFVEFRSVGTRYRGSVDGVGPTAIGKPPGYQAGDLLVCHSFSTFGTLAPLENPGPWIQLINVSTQGGFWRIATGDANDDYTLPSQSGTGITTCQMAAFNLKGLTSVSQVAGGSLLQNDSSYTTSFPACSFSQYNNDQSLTLSYYFKSQNNNAGAVSLVDNLPGVVTGADALATIETYVVNGLNGNPGGNRSSWGGWTYWVTNGNPADAVPFGTDQTETPESSGFEVVSHWGNRFRITT